MLQPLPAEHPQTQNLRIGNKRLVEHRVPQKRVRRPQSLEQVEPDNNRHPAGRLVVSIAAALHREPRGLLLRLPVERGEDGREDPLRDQD